MSRIASVKTTMISVPRQQPVWTAHEPSKAWNVILTEVRTDDGLTGYGLIHGAPMREDLRVGGPVWRDHPGHGCAGPCRGVGTAVRADLARAWPDRGPGRIAAAGAARRARPVHGGASAASTSRCGTSRGRPPACRSTASSAARTGRSSPMPPAAITGRAPPTATMAPRWPGSSKLGYRAVKLKTGAGTVAAEAARIGTVRRMIGDEPLLMLDMNAAYDLPDCIEFAHAVEPHASSGSRSRCTGTCSPPISRVLRGGDPDPAGPWRARADPVHGARLFVDGGIRYVQFDATRSGGFTEALRVAQLAEQHGVMVAPHTAPEIHAHIVLAQPRCAFGVEIAWRPGARPAGLRPVPSAPAAARRLSAHRRRARVRPRGRLGSSSTSTASAGDRCAGWGGAVEDSADDRRSAAPARPMAQSPASASGWCRRWAPCTRGIWRWSARRGPDATGSSPPSSSTLSSSPRTRISAPIRAARRPISTCCAAAGVDLSLCPPPAEIYPADSRPWCGSAG